MKLLRTLTPLGWTVAAVAVICWLAARRLGWVELAMASAACGSAAALALLFTVGRSRMTVSVEVLPERVVAGETMYGRVVTANSSSRRQLARRLELPIGRDVATFAVPWLAAGAEHEESFRLPTTRRGVIAVGPARIVRADPAGLARREQQLSALQQLYVHPVTCRLEPLGAGVIRDLEGLATEQLSASDLAFHALREYVPGDDLRHVHWRTSARLASVAGAGSLLVRQYVDTRRSRLALMVAADRAQYADEDEFELAVSVVGSLGIRAIADGQGVSVFVGRQEVNCTTTRRLLDGLAEVELAGSEHALDAAVTQAVRSAPDASIAFLLAGTPVSPARLRACTHRLGTDPRVIALRAAGRAGLRRQVLGTMSLLTLGTLSDLPRLLQLEGKG